MLVSGGICDRCFVVLGTTPQRREFEYPRMLSKTSPHVKIVEEFRRKYIEQEAIDTALPCEVDSDEEMVHYSQYSVIDTNTRAYSNFTKLL